MNKKRFSPDWVECDVSKVDLVGSFSLTIGKKILHGFLKSKLMSLYNILKVYLKD